ncbi:divalent-cation tolerance protein CutA [Silvibacterium acidisoli]|uniref:divalent-cation tolerance protein CutA n=1 Tax=Acidobacteriaceae bacterium ZG23-2 TaxID=2883246 RepID=UPI00406D1B69
MMSEIGKSPRIVLSTAGTREEAEKIARALVENHLAACVNLVSGLTSIYRWKGGIEKAEETLLLIKTVEGKLPELESTLHALHSYDVPEFLVLPVEGGSDAYLRWLLSSVGAISEEHA